MIYSNDNWSNYGGWGVVVTGGSTAASPMADSISTSLSPAEKDSIILLASYSTGSRVLEYG